MLLSAMMHELVSQFPDNSIEHRKRPAPFEDPLRRLIVRRLALITLLAARDFEGQNRPPAAFLSTNAIAFVGQEELQGGENKGPEPSLFLVCTIKISAFQHSEEKLLRDVLRLVGRITPAASISV
jgi:hypothetical protein